MAEIVLNWGCQYVIVTHGARGVTGYYYSSDSNVSNNNALTSSYTNTTGHNNLLISLHQNAAHSINVVDSTGAGDSFIGAFLVAWNHPDEPWSLKNDISVNDSSDCNLGTSMSTLSQKNGNKSENHSDQKKIRLNYALFHGCVSGGSAVTLVGGSTVASTTFHYHDIANNHMK